MTNNDYMHILELLDNQNRGNKYIYYTMVGLVCVAGVAIYYHYKIGQQTTIIGQMQKNLDILNATQLREKELNQQLNRQLNECKELNKQTEYEKAILASKLAAKETGISSSVKS